MAAFNKFNSFVAYQANAGVNLTADTLKVMLTNTAPVATNTSYSGGSSNISGNEVANGNGYTTGGISLTSNSATQTSGLLTLSVSPTSYTWTASGAFGAFRYVVVYDSSTTGTPLIGWWDYGSTLSLTSGQTFTVSFASGILTNQ